MNVYMVTQNIRLQHLAQINSIPILNQLIPAPKLTAIYTRGTSLAPIGSSCVKIERFLFTAKLQLLITNGEHSN